MISGCSFLLHVAVKTYKIRVPDKEARRLRLRTVEAQEFRLSPFGVIGGIEVMAETMTQKKKWRCTVCGYVCEAVEPPESCPECYAPREAFVEE